MILSVITILIKKAKRGRKKISLKFKFNVNYFYVNFKCFRTRMHELKKILFVEIKLLV